MYNLIDVVWCKNMKPLKKRQKGIFGTWKFEYYLKHKERKKLPVRKKK